MRLRRIFGLLLACALWLPAGPLEAQKTEKADGYAEWRKGDMLIVDGQRVQADDRTKFKGKKISSLASIPLGYEVIVTGRRLEDGTLVAGTIEAKPNGTALFEDDVKKATDEIEAIWLRSRTMFEPGKDGKREEIGPIVESGPAELRVHRILTSLVPPYVSPNQLRTHVVETDEWNAAAMGNGALWVYTGLLDEMSDDEMAIILGHELTHYTHEHSRRNAKKAMWGEIAAATAVVALEQVDDDTTRGLALLGTMLSFTAWQSGYSRDLEDQADRVGLRYAYEAGYDVTKGPRVWERFRDKYGDSNAVTNFFFGGHSRPSDRIRNIERELRLNYRDIRQD